MRRLFHSAFCFLVKLIIQKLDCNLGGRGRSWEMLLSCTEKTKNNVGLQWAFRNKLLSLKPALDSFHVFNMT